MVNIRSTIWRESRNELLKFLVEKYIDCNLAWKPLRLSNLPEATISVDDTPLALTFHFSTLYCASRANTRIRTLEIN